jgi:hypothetical protein
MVLQEQSLGVEHGRILAEEQSLYLHKLNIGICLGIVAKLGRVAVLIFVVGLVSGFGFGTGRLGLDVSVSAIQSTVIIIHNRGWRLAAGWHSSRRQCHALSVTQIVSTIG